jgi:signal transduction histidine kinase/FixJ family two-component response regulator
MAAMTPLSGPEAGIRTRIRVLVVDDSVDHRTLIADKLEAVGMQVETAGSATDALEHLGEADLVLLDYRLPGNSGLDLLQRIRQRRRAPSVIMVTGAGSTQVAVAAMRAGAINYVAKDRGYLETLPEVVERAWHHHDLAERAAELQRLALLVTSATDRDTLFREIVEGATRLLRARSCALLLEEQGALVPVVEIGDMGPRPSWASTLTAGGLDRDEPGLADDGGLVVPLPGEGGAAAGVLLVWPDDPAVTAEEQQLAEVFASFAGIALRNLREFELERRLITELQQTLDARRDFIASISHELRTPLTSISGFTTTLLEHWAELEGEVRADLLQRIGRNAENLGEVVDELLDLAGIERGNVTPIEPEMLELPEQVRRAIGQYEHVLDGRDLRVTVPPVQVYADASLLRRTLGNLLSNAAKFSDAGSPIEIDAQLEAERVRVAVVDHGIGLPSWEASRVFEPFFRAHSSIANAVRGSGIGLALVREYVRSMGGEVTVDSTPGEGSTFAFTLPTAPTVVDPSDDGSSAWLWPDAGGAGPA